MSKSEKDATKDATRGAIGAPPPETAAEETQPPRTVQYVVARPYSAGEPYDVVTAKIKGQDEKDATLLDLLIPGPDGKDVTVKDVRRSDRQEPGTWFKEGEA
jgi:hypothetical protein